MKKLRFVLIFLVSVIVFSLCFLYLEQRMDKRGEGLGDRDSLDEDLLGQDNVIEKKVDNELLFLLVGTDFSKAEEKGKTRSDTLILIKVDTDTGNIVIYSIPRDTYVDIDGKKTKINHAHAYGGITLTMKTVRNLTGLDVDYFVRMDYSAVEDIIDAVGGIELDVPFSLNKERDEVDVPKGHSRLNGKQALGVLRDRRHHTSGDLGRVEMQQYFLSELIDQVLKPQNIKKLPKIYETYKEKVDTNIPSSSILQIIGAASNFASSDIETYTLDGRPGYLYDSEGNKVSYYFPDLKKVHEKLREIMPDYILPVYQTQDNIEYWDEDQVEWN